MRIRFFREASLLREHSQHIFTFRDSRTLIVREISEPTALKGYQWVCQLIRPAEFHSTVRTPAFLYRKTQDGKLQPQRALMSKGRRSKLIIRLENLIKRKSNLSSFRPKPRNSSLLLTTPRTNPRHGPKPKRERGKVRILRLREGPKTLSRRVEVIGSTPIQLQKQY